EKGATLTGWILTSSRPSREPRSAILRKHSSVVPHVRTIDDLTCLHSFSKACQDLITFQLSDSLDQTDRLGGNPFLPTDHADSLSPLHHHRGEVRSSPHHLRLLVRAA